MVTEEEIRRVADFMRIEADDYKEYIGKVHAMIDYFGMLDSAGVEDEEISMQDIDMAELRRDEHSPFQDDLIKSLKTHRGGYIRAPKMS